MRRSLMLGGLGRNRQAVASGGFTPADLGAKLEIWFPAGPSYWFTDTAGTTPVASDGDLVKAMRDYTGTVILTEATNPPTAHIGANGKWYVSFDGTNDTLIGTVSLTIAAFYGTINLLSFSTYPAVADNGTALRAAPAWFPDAATLYSGDSTDALHTYTTRVNGVSTSTWPGAAVWAVMGCVKNSGSGAFTSSLRPSGSTAGGDTYSNIAFTDLVWVNSQLTTGGGSEEESLEAWLADQIPT